MTMILRDVGSLRKGSHSITVTNSQTDRLLLYNKDGGGSKIELSLVRYLILASHFHS